MPTPVKPCQGQFSEETIAALESNTGRAQWLAHPCTLCGQSAGARLEKGKWLPEQHWPSVQYKQRTPRLPKRSLTQGTTVPSQS